MAYVEGGKPVGRDNRKSGSPASFENLVNQVHSPRPHRPIENGMYQSPAKSITSIAISGTTATVTYIAPPLTG